MDKQRFVDEIPRVLLTLQYVEEALRQYMFRANVMIASEVRPFLHYAHDDPALSRASLGRLVSMFSRVNSDAELHRRLRALVPRRNFCAHQAYLASAGFGATNEETQYDCVALEQTRLDGERCLQSLFEEIQQLEARLVTHKKSGV